MLRILGLLLVVWLVVTVLGAVVHALFWIGLILFIGTAVYAWSRRSVGPGGRRSLP
jgi:hypothetical protein